METTSRSDRIDSMWMTGCKVEPCTQGIANAMKHDGCVDVSKLITRDHGYSNNNRYIIAILK